MKSIPSIIVLFFILITALLIIAGCSYDNEEDLYPLSQGCDTLNVTYLSTIEPIVNAHCYECHSGTSPIAGFSFDDYTRLKDLADNGRLWGAIHHDSGFIPMPKNRPQLSECNLSKIRIWIEGGALNN